MAARAARAAAAWCVWCVWSATVRAVAPRSGHSASAVHSSDGALLPGWNYSGYGSFPALFFGAQNGTNTTLDPLEPTSNLEWITKHQLAGACVCVAVAVAVAVGGGIVWHSATARNADGDRCDHGSQAMCLRAAHLTCCVCWACVGYGWQHAIGRMREEDSLARVARQTKQCVPCAAAKPWPLQGPRAFAAVQPVPATDQQPRLAWRKRRV